MEEPPPRHHSQVHCPAAGIATEAPTIGMVLQKSHIATKDDGHYVARPSAVASAYSAFVRALELAGKRREWERLSEGRSAPVRERRETGGEMTGCGSVWTSRPQNIQDVHQAGACGGGWGVSPWYKTPSPHRWRFPPPVWSCCVLCVPVVAGGHGAGVGAAGCTSVLHLHRWP